MPIDFPDPSVSTQYTNPSNGNIYIYANGSWSLQSILAATKGGTGFASYNQGDILFGNASGTLSKLAASTVGYVLSTNGSGADPSWIAMSAGGAGTVSTPGARYQLAGYYAGSGASVSGSSTFTNDTSTGIVSITHSTGSTSPSFGALLVGGGVGIAGTLSYYRSQIGVAGTSSIPSMAFIGNTNNPVYLNVLENNALSFEGYHGQLLSISPDLVSGYVFSVGDISGIPLLRANANANVTANEYGGNFGIGTTNPSSKLDVNGNVRITGTAVTLFPSATSNYLIMNTGSGGVLRIQTDVVNSRVRMFENMTTTGSLGFFGTSGGTLYLGTDSGTQNGNITIRGNNTTGGGGDQRAAIFTLATATSNGTGSGGTMVFQTSTSGNATILSNILRTRLRIEGAATGTSHNESIIILGDTNSGTAWTSYLRGVDATGTDVAAGEIQIQAGRSTGTGNAQGISFYVSQSAAASTTAVNTASQIGRFSATGLTINSTTASISTSSGALIVAGGAGIAGSLNVGALSKFSDHLEVKTQKELRLYNSADTYYTALKAGLVASSSKTFTLPIDYGTSGQFLTTDGFGVLSFTTDPIQVNSGSINQVAFYSSAGSSVSGSSTFTNDTSGGVVTISHNTSSTGFSTGALVLFGGLGLSGAVRIGDTTTSNSTVTGALTVRGGVGIGNNLYVGSQLSVSSTANLFGAVTFQNEISTVTFQNRIIKSGSIGLTMSGVGTNGAVLQVQQANIKETGIGAGTSVATIIPAISFRKQTFSAVNSGITYTNAANVFIEDAPDSSVTGAIGAGYATTNTVNILNSYALYVQSGKTFLGGALLTGGNTYAKNPGNGDIALDNGTRDTPGILYYWDPNRNFGTDVYFSGSGTTRYRIVKELNESGGAELWSIDRDGVVYKSNWAVGEIVKTQTYNYSDLGMTPDPNSVNSTAYTTVATASYTPASTSSYLWIEFSATYDYNAGTGADEFAANIEVGGSEIINVFQKFLSASGGGSRSGVLFPLSGRYTNSSTSTLSITVRVKRLSGDDPIRVYGNAGSGLMRIQEIQR